MKKAPPGWGRLRILTVNGAYPRPQPPPQQLPPEGPGISPPPLPWAEKSDSSFEVSPAPHEGHSKAVAALAETSFSKIRLQALQRYS
jgi:hypothetical protein